MTNKHLCMMTKEQQLQILSLNPGIVVRLIEDFVYDDGAMLMHKRPQIRKELAYLLVDVANLVLPNELMDLKKKYVRELNVRIIFNLPF